MNHCRLPMIARALLLLLCLIQPVTAWAYIDPNAGGMLFQLLAPLFAAVLGAWVFLRRWIGHQIKRLWRKLTGRQPLE